MENPRGQVAGQDAPDEALWNCGRESSDRTQLAALWHLAIPVFPGAIVRPALEGQIPVFIQCFESYLSSSSRRSPGSGDGKAAKSAGPLTSHWTSATTTCTK